jgi:hypothetical protein
MEPTCGVPVIAPMAVSGVTGVVTAAVAELVTVPE